MTEYISKLYQISKKEKKKVIGLMSGTSLDGLDIALCEIEGNGKHTQIKLLEFQTIPYEIAFRDEIKKIISTKQADLALLCQLNAQIGSTHARMINDSLIKWNVANNEIDFIASHGQTIFHAPCNSNNNSKGFNSTLQIGDGDHIAVKTGIITICDFRQKHIAAGGEGAPLVTYGDYLLFSKKEKNRILLNIGGIANFTFIPADANFNDIISSDIGPGNLLMDIMIQNKYPDKTYDHDAEIAEKGTVNDDLLFLLLSHPYFQIKSPKTTGAELFNKDYVFNAMNKSNTMNIAFEDLMATLNRFTAVSICDAFQKLNFGGTETELFISGGGMHNPLLLSYIQKNIPGITMKKFDTEYFNPDAKESVLFAVLANETISGNKNNFDNGNPSMPNISMGKICFPL